MIPDSVFWTLDDVKNAIDREDYKAAREIATAVGMRAAENYESAEVAALMAAGWMPQFLLPGGDGMPYQWKWRRPSKRPGKPGRLFQSTSQAFNAMQKENV